MGLLSSITNFFDDDDDNERDDELEEDEDFDDDEDDDEGYSTPVPPPVQYDPQTQVDQFTPLLQVVAMYNGTQYAYLKHESMVYRSIDGGDWEPIDGFFDQRYEVFIGSNDIIGFVESGEPQHPFGVFHANGSISTWSYDTAMGDVVKARVNKTETPKKSNLNTHLDNVTGVAPAVNYTAMAWADNVVSDRHALEAARSGQSVTRIITAAMVSSVASVLANTVSEAVYTGLAKAATSKIAKDLANNAARAAMNSAVGIAARKAAGDLVGKAASKIAGNVAQKALTSTAKSATKKVAAAAAKKAASSAAKKAASSAGKKVASGLIKGFFK